MLYKKRKRNVTKCLVTTGIQRSFTGADKALKIKNMRKSKKFPFLSVKLVNYQRNGISGNGFYVISFDWNEPDEVCKNMVATVFEEEGSCGVVCLDDLTRSWRGDYFETALRDAIKRHDDAIWRKLSNNSRVKR